MRGREYTIRQQQRHKAKQAQRAKDNGWLTTDKAIGIMTNTPTPCSGRCCGNPRKHAGNGECGKTFQELKQDEVPMELVPEHVVYSDLEQMP